MKKIVSLLLILFMICCTAFATSYKLTVKGEAYVKTEDGEMYALDEGENSIQTEDTIILGEKSSVVLYVDSNKIIIRAAGVYKVSDLVE